MLDILITLVNANGEAADGGAVLAHTEVVLRDAGNVQLVLDLLADPREWIRLSAIQLLTLLVYNRQPLFEAALLQCPAALTQLMDVLHVRCCRRRSASARADLVARLQSPLRFPVVPQDKREEVRNEALLLLLRLTESNQEIQQFFAFQVQQPAPAASAARRGRATVT